MGRRLHVLALPAVAALGAVLVRPSTPIAQADIPLTKAGLWQGSAHISGDQPVTSTFCGGGQPIVPPPAGKCSRYEVARTAAGAIVSDSTCVDKRGVTWVLHGVVVGDLSTAFTQDGVMKIYPPGPGHAPRVITGHVTFRYVGACPPGKRPS